MDMRKEINTVVFNEGSNLHKLFENFFNKTIVKYGFISIADIKEELMALEPSLDFNITYIDTSYGYDKEIYNGMFKRESRFGLQINLPEPKKL